jgi:hypothetical protein|tara:strand:+ start:379 stop:549 length:171 start_codon:yes stop_codon:yes gene_type:complete
MKTKQDVETWMNEQSTRWQGITVPSVFVEIYDTVPDQLHGTALLYAITQGWITLND